MGKSVAKQLQECRDALDKANARANSAEAEVASLRQHLQESVPAFKFEALVRLSKSQDEQIHDLTCRNRELEFYRGDNVWHWQHDGQDFLNSLSVPVVISADHLRQLLKGINTHTEAELTEKLELVRQQRDDEMVLNGTLNEELEHYKRKLSAALLHMTCMIRFVRQERPVLASSGEFMSALTLVKENPESITEQHLQQCPDLFNAVESASSLKD